MQHHSEASYYRRREREEMERAHHSSNMGARSAHLGLAALYRRQLGLLNYQAVMLVDIVPEQRQ